MREMRDSGIPWIGEIPKEWAIVRLKDIANIQRGGSPRPIEEYLSETGYNWIKIGDTIKGDKYIHSVKQKIKESGLYKTRMVFRGDLILTNSMSFGEPYILNVDGCIHDGWVAFSNIRATDKEFLYYLLCSPLCKMQFDLQVAGGVVQNLNVDKISSTSIVLPSLVEQQRITEFLDRKCAEVDEMIALQEQIIEELKAYKQSVITEAVTKGLNPAAPMRDSGIEWIGSIPEHWEMKRGKFMFQILSGAPFESELFTNDSNYMPLIRIRDIMHEDTEAYYMGAYTQEYIVSKGDILVGMDGDFNVASWKGKNALLNQRVCKLYNFKSDIHPRFIYYTLPLLLKRKNDLTYATTVKHLSTFDILAFSFTIPPITEQQTIADYLDEKCADIDSLIQTKQSKIDSLKEYKKSIIYEYVTGKREVE